MTEVSTALPPAARRIARQFYVFTAVQSVNLWAPIYVLFLLGRGFTLAQTTLLSSVWWACSVALEVPTGVLADRWGRRNTLLLGSLCLLATFIVLAMARSFAMVSLAYVLWALAVSLTSGSDSALLYDSLIAAGGSHKYREIYGRLTAIGLAMSGLGALSAGYLGEIDLMLPIAVSAGFAGTEILVLLTMREPERATPQGTGSPWAVLGAAIRGRLMSRSVWAVVLTFAGVYTALWVLGVFYQPYLRGLGFRVSQMGWLYLAFKVPAILGSMNSGRITRLIGERKQLVGLVFLLAASTLILARANAWLAVAFIGLNFLFYGALGPLVNSMINNRTESQHRATVLSITSLCGSLLLVPAQPLFGLFAQTWGLDAGFGLVAALLLITTLAAVGTVRLLSRCEDN